MELTLIRHGRAGAPRADGSDAVRPLTAAGARDLARQIDGLRRAGARVDRLYHSPLLRAVQSADIAMRLCKGESAVTPLLARAPGPKILEELATSGAERVALVGHEPWLSRLAAWLATGKRRNAEWLTLKKGGVALLVGEPRPGGMKLVGLWTPKLLRDLG